MSTCRIGRPSRSSRHRAARRRRRSAGARARAAGWRAGGTPGGSATARSSSTRAAVAPGSRSSREPGTRSAKTRTPCTEATVKPAPASSAATSSAVNRRPAAAGAAAASASSSSAQGLLEVAGHRPGDHGGVPLGDQQAERAAGAQHRADRGQRGGGVVDDLEHAVAEHQVGAVGADHVEQAGQVALLAGDRRRRRSRARRASAARASGLGSTTVTRWPSSATRTAKPPVPPPMSRTSRGLVAAAPARSAVPHHGGAGGCRGARWARSMARQP